MSSDIKHIQTIGLLKREVGLIESFLDLIGDESYQFVLDENHEHKPAVIIVDELSHSDDIDIKNPSSLILVIGEDTANPDPTYLHRPIQWSKFKTGINQIKADPESTVEEAGLTQVIEVDGSKEDQDKSKSYRVGSISSAAPYAQGEDVGAQGEGAEQLYSVEKPSAESLIQIETEPGVTLSQSDIELSEKYAGLDRLGININFWGEQACQVIVGGISVLFIQPEKSIVYSEYVFEDWEPLLRAKDVRKAYLEKDWVPSGKMKSYPISWMSWASAHARSKGYLLSSLQRDAFFLLDKWPEFDLLYNNNEHLKLCGLMFKEGQSIQELVSKTHIRARVIIGLINACYRHGVLSFYPDKDSARPKVNTNVVDTHTVMSLLSKVFK